MNQQLDISHLEALAQSYFDCRLDRHEERDLAAVLATSPLSSPLIDECRLAMGMELVAKRAPRVAVAARRFSRARLWMAAASAAVVCAIGASVFFAPSTGVDAQPAEYAAVYVNGHKMADTDHARDIAERKMRKDMLMFNEMLSVNDDIQAQLDEIESILRQRDEDIRMSQIN